MNSYSDADGTHPYLDFSPALRFVPSKTTILTFNMKKVSISDYSTINYCVTADLCVNEGLTDPSLATFNDGKGKLALRQALQRLQRGGGHRVRRLGSWDPDCIDLGGDRGWAAEPLDRRWHREARQQRLADGGCRDERQEEEVGLHGGVGHRGAVDSYGHLEGQRRCWWKVRTMNRR